MASAALRFGAAIRVEGGAREEGLRNYNSSGDRDFSTSVAVGMNSAKNTTSTDDGSNATSQTTDTAAKQGPATKGGSNSKDSDSEGEGAEEVCLLNLISVG